MEPFDFSDLRHSLPALQTSHPPVMNVNQAFHLPVAASATGSGTNATVGRCRRRTLARSSGTTQDTHQTPRSSVAAHDSPSLTRSGLVRDMSQNVELQRVSKLSRRERNKSKSEQRKLSRQEGWHLSGNEDRAFKALEKKGYLKQSDKKTNVAFFREHFFGKKKYGWTTNADGKPQWSAELLHRGGLTHEEWTATRKPKSKTRQKPAENMIRKEHLVGPEPVNMEAAMETDTAPISKQSVTLAKDESSKSELLEFLSSCTDLEAAKVGKEGFIHELALQIGKHEAANIEAVAAKHECERRKYAGLTYEEHKDLERMQATPADRLVINI